MKYKHILILLIVLFLGMQLLTAQKPGTSIITQPNLKTKQKPGISGVKKEDGMTNFQIGGGIMGSVLYLSRNINEDNDAYGWTISANYGGHKLFRFSAQYTHYTPINIAPTWYTIKAHTLEGNIEVLARFKDNKTFLYPFAGLSYNTFKGYFTGANDYLNLREKYKANSTVTSYWVGVNVGTGLEHSFGPVILFMDYRMRVGRSDDGKGITIQDVCYSGGLRIKLVSPTLKKIYRGINDRYHWF